LNPTLEDRFQAIALSEQLPFLRNILIVAKGLKVPTPIIVANSTPIEKGEF
jgi:hypothetical protein